MFTANMPKKNKRQKIVDLKCHSHQNQVIIKIINDAISDPKELRIQ